MELAAQFRQQLLQLRVQPRLVFVRALLPYEAVLVRVGFKFRPVYKKMFKCDLAHLMQMMYKLTEQLVCTLRQSLAPKPCNLKVARRSGSVQQKAKACPVSSGTPNFTSTVPVLMAS